MCIQVRIIGIRVRITSRGRIAEVVLGCSGHYIDPFCGGSRFKLEFECVGRSTTIKVESGKKVERTSIIGVPIIIERKQNNRKHSGRFVVIGVVGLTSEEKHCPCYWDPSDENTRSLGEFCLVCAYIHLGGLTEKLTG